MTSSRSCCGGTTPYLAFIISIVSLGPFQFGFHLAELNAPQQAIICTREMSKLRILNLPACIEMSEAKYAFVTSIFTLGGFLGAICGGPASSRHGRLLTMRTASLACIIGSSLVGFASNVLTLVAGRFLSGLGAGLSLVVVPLYIFEVAPPDSKGLFGATTQIAVNSGILLTLILGFFFGHGAEWRLILAVGGAVAIVQGFALHFVAESPAWLALNSEHEMAVNLLRRIRGKGTDVHAELKSLTSRQEPCDDELAGLLDDELVRYGTSIPVSKPEQKGAPQVDILEVVRNSQYRPALIAVLGVMAAQQLTGINSVMMYSVSLLSPLFPGTSSLITVSLSLINLLFTIICAPLPDLLGRKLTLLLSIAGMGLSALSLALSMLFSFRILTGISALCFVAFFGVGLGAIPFILASELVQREASAATQSAGLATNWMATFAVAQFSPMINEKLNKSLGGSGWVFFIFAALAALAAMFVAIWVPETREKKSLEEVQE